jgi:formate hydrogenlyase subunit 3/multisubunit Na+/H+ antiporter MnhD subunit
VQVPMTASVKHANTGEPIKCALVTKPSKAERHKSEMLRYAIVAVASLAVLLLIAIAFYYTQGNSLTVKHVSAFRPYLSFHARA